MLVPRCGSTIYAARLRETEDSLKKKGYLCSSVRGIPPYRAGVGKESSARVFSVRFRPD
jgi:hypothetical protein